MTYPPRVIGMHIVPVALALIAMVSAAGYFAVAPLFQQFPAKLYRVELTRSGGGLGTTVNITASIIELGTGYVTMLQRSSLESVPPYHSYLVVKAGSETTYAVVFWTSSTNGTQYVSFQRLPVPTANPSGEASFVYSAEGINDVSLGTH